MALPAGVTFVANIKGDKGDVGTFSGVTIQSVAAGSPAEASISGPASARVLNLKVPRGLPGVNAVPADEAVAAFIGALDSDTRKAFNSATGQVSVPNVTLAVSTPVGPAINTLVLRGYATEGDGGGATYVRVSSEPSHAGKIRTNDGAWWEISEKVLRPQMFGARPLSSTVTSLTVARAADVTDAWNAMSEAAYKLGRSVAVSAGRWAHSGTLRWYDGITYRGDVAGDTWRTVNTSNDASWPNVKYTELTGAVFVAIGTFDRDFTLRGITAGAQTGWGRNVYLVDRPHGNGLDSRMDALDLTNQDAVGSAAATLRPFSAAHHFVGDSQRRHRIEDVTFIPNCPSGGDTFGLGGYGLKNSIPSWADVDFGVYAPSPFTGYFRFQSLGYWNDRGLLLTGQKYSNANIGYAENNVFEKCAIQAGVAIRQGDSWPVKSKTSTTVTLRWTASHTFNPTGFLFLGRSQWSYTSMQYSSVSYSPDNGGELTFRMVGSTADVTVGGERPDHAWTALGAGFPLTIFRDCEIFDWSHASGIYDMSPELGSRQRAWSASIEIAGGTTSNIRFENSAVRTHGPMAMLLGSPANIEFDKCWIEGRGSRRMTTSSSTILDGGTVAIGGPTPAMKEEVGEAGVGSVYFGVTDNLHVHTNVHPYYQSPAQYAFSIMDNLMTLNFHDDGKVRGVRDTPDYRLWGLRNVAVDIRARKLDNIARRVVTGYPSGATGLGESFVDNHGIFIPDRVDTDTAIRVNRTLKPGTDNAMALGQASNRWTQLFAGSATINTSDARVKEQIRELSEKEQAVARSLKGLIRVFKMTESVQEKGGDARLHVGVLAQEVIAVFEAEGLDALEYGIVCHDEWEAVEAVEPSEDNSVAPNPGREAGDLYGIRYEELIAFIIAAL